MTAEILKDDIHENLIWDELKWYKNDIIDSWLNSMEMEMHIMAISSILEYWEDPAVSNFNNIISQRDKALSEYGKDAINTFVNSKRKDFKDSYNEENSVIKGVISELWIILNQKFNINTKWKEPEQILSIALQILSNEKDMGWLKEFSQKLSWDFDINFINCYWYIQALNPNTWKQKWGKNIIERKLSGIVWHRTIQFIMDKLKNWTFDSISTNPAISEPENIPQNSHGNNWISLDDIILDDEENSSNPSTTPTENTNTSDESSDPIQEEATTQPAWLQWSWNWGLLNLDDTEDDTEDNTDNNNNEENHNDAPTINGNWWDDNLQDNTNRESNNPLDDLSQYWYVDEDVEIARNMTWNAEILSQKLNQNKLDNITYQQIIDVVDWFKYNNLKQIVMFHLLKNDIISAQKILWMDVNCDNHYPDYVAWNKLWITELNKMKMLWWFPMDTELDKKDKKDRWQFRRFEDQEEILNNGDIPEDVKDAYQKFLSKELNNWWKNYVILSKFDYRVYLFSSDNHLLSRQNVVVWSTPWDQKNDIKKGIHTTPWWLYQIWWKYENYAGKDFFKIYWTHYIVLSPLEDQYDTQNDTYSMGIHWDFKWDKDRKQKLESENSRDHRWSNGCVNTDSDTFGEIYNHLEYGWKFYVTHEK